ncbi:formate dehydrogenase accessory protein FdhD [Variovorax paradoxus B4]|uniref:Sulfur carrier protein FdhD n=2 Tax=Variovorax paradoxus TaxID=34073 RepID=A0A0H2MDF7_VARPD|nr:formate dehydrogenase accessory sulfurtransferase FdhD [Variovorax paradoxus]AGU50175.1 formate dehydrogenase accessory protein FdhD [Variovorax paradoxus B4]KLN58697.1 protein FdhD [Variovorax paradoxus]
MNLSDVPLRPGSAELLPVRGVRALQAFDNRDWVAVEVPVALEFNGIAHAVMLATPTDLADFALGFALSEGILLGRGELYGVEEAYAPEGITLTLEVASAAFARLKARRRTMAGRTGCGLCGTESLAHVTRALPPLPEGPALSTRAVARGMRELASMQVLQKVTGAVHAAAWCSAEGEALLVREDVGRHNALDKLVGALARSSVDASTGFIAVTSRASFEMVQKTVAAGVPLLAAVSASTSLATAIAEDTGLTLAGFVRGDDLVIYTHPWRLNGLPANA